MEGKREKQNGKGRGDATMKRKRPPTFLLVVGALITIGGIALWAYGVFLAWQISRAVK